MAQRVEILLVDDVDGSEATQTVRFGLDGMEFEIDLNDAHADEMRSAIDKFVNVARRKGGKSRAARPKAPAGKTVVAAPRSSKTTQVPASLEAVRVWARANGHNISDRGRIARSVMEAFEAANS